MKEIQNIHRRAMEHIDLALLARMKGKEERALTLLRSAYELESQAAQGLEANFDAEPSRSVLFRSAATLAYDCKLYSESEQLIYKALLGRPPLEIVDELKDLLDQVSFQRHLDMRGVEISPEEFQMSLTGKSVGFGIAPLDVFLGRVRSTENLLFRTAERKQGRQYRERGPRGKSVNDNMQLYVTVPRAACFAVTFRIGSSSQLSLPGLSEGGNVIDELLECLDLYTNGKEEELKKRINEEAYYRNFISLAQNIEPDGSDVDMVGFTTIRHGKAKQVALRRTRAESPKLSRTDIFSTSNEKTNLNIETVQIRGVLKLADSRKKEDQIEIIMSGNASVKIIVPSGMMSDIVKPLWDTEVEVTGTKKGKKVYLMQIRSV